jgi:UDP-N-acetylmuramyl pentapeptide phosphotransferase/UDP-N-acetylglucosamine-1-phosphate transferase
VVQTTQVIEAFIYVAAFTLTVAGVSIFRRYAVARAVLDVPNERSSHSQPTPRGGGLIIVFVCLTVYLLYTIFVGHNFSWGYFFGAVMVALVSWFDDLRSVSTALRFLVHGIAAAFVISNLGAWQTIYFPVVGDVSLGIVGALLTFLWIVWLTNAYNFMDGIDGIAAAQAITAGFGWIIVGWILGNNFFEFYGGVIAFSSLGFLIHNWQPARIFMGDVGSAFLGFTFAAFPLLTKNENSSPAQGYLPWLGVLMVAPFVADSVLTFLRRAIRGEKVWEAHRDHLYQRLVQRGHSHAFVACAYALVSSAIVVFIAYAISRP